MRTVFLLLSLGFLLSCGPSPDKASTAPGAVTFEVITTGKMIDLQPHVAQGAFTVFDFYADWCPPCIKLNESLKDMKKVYGDRLEIRKLDLVAWDSELAKGMNIKDLPYLIIHGPDGQKLFQGQSSQVLPKLLAALNE